MEPKGKVLVVDDEYLNLRLFSAVLTNAGYVVVGADNGGEAKELVPKHPDLGMIVSDLNMETRSAGIDFARWYRATHPDSRVPIVIHTNDNGIDELREAARGAGVTEIHPKLDNPALRDTVNRLYPKSL